MSRSSETDKAGIGKKNEESSLAFVRSDWTPEMGPRYNTVKSRDGAERPVLATDQATTN